MSKALPFVALLFIIFVTPSFAHQDNPNKKDIDIGITQEVECDAQGQWDNHGAYVSCVAHTQPGGAAVSAAAKSEVGKKSNGPSATPAASPTLAVSPSPSPEVSPSPSPSVSPTPVVTPSPEASPTPEASPNPEASPSPEALTLSQKSIITDVLQRLNQLIGILNNLL